MVKIPLLYKMLVVGVIVLFIGMVVQPAIAQPDILDFKPENMYKDELTAKVNKIMQENDIKITKPAFIIISGILFYMMVLGFNVIMMLWIFWMYLQHGGAP